MEQTYWLGRKRISAANARLARSAEARLIHLDLAGRYSIKAASAGPAVSPAALPLADAGYYGRLESGARWLASRAARASERDSHLDNADRYARLRLDSAPEDR